AHDRRRGRRRGDRPRPARLRGARAAGPAAALPRHLRARPQRGPDASHAGDARRRVSRAHREGAARLMRLAVLIALAATLAAPAAADEGPMAHTRQVLEQSSVIVKGPGDRKQKLTALSEL